MPMDIDEDDMMSGFGGGGRSRGRAGGMPGGFPGFGGGGMPRSRSEEWVPFESQNFPPGNSRSDSGPSSSRANSNQVVKQVPLSLEDLYKGVTKKLKITRKVLDATGKPTQTEKVIQIDVKPGWWV